MKDDVQNELLDSEFRQILYMIKPFINHINDHKRLERYKVWLERLSSVHPSEKIERNKYLLELANQIHDNVLKPPFTHDPPKCLLPQTHKNVLPTEDPAEISEHFFQKEEKAQWPYLSQQAKNKRPEGKKKNSKVKVIQQPFQQLGKGGEGSESTSWCDLSDTTSITQDETDGGQVKKKLSLQHKAEGLKAQEHFQKKYEEEKVKKSSAESLENSRKAQELDALKMRMKDLLEVKMALRDTHCLTEDRKRTIEVLQGKLACVEQKNCELKSQIEAQEKKLMDLDQAKSKELNDFKEKFLELRQKELESLMQQHKNEISSLQKKHEDYVSDLEIKIASLKKEYEERMKILTDSNMSLIKQKDEEIQQLQNKLNLRSSQMNNEGNGEQIISLKRCISKLDKVLHKNEKDYTKKIERLRQEMEVKDMTNQMQLQTQRADLIVRHNTTKQEELKHALNSLEGKYKKMIEYLQTHALMAKKQDDKTIDDLKSLLEKNNIPY